MSVSAAITVCRLELLPLGARRTDGWHADGSRARVGGRRRRPTGAPRARLQGGCPGFGIGGRCNSLGRVDVEPDEGSADKRR